MLDNNQNWMRKQIFGGSQQPFLPAHEEFRTRLQSAWPSVDAEREVTAAFAAYMAVIQSPWGLPDLGKRAVDAYAECRKRLHETFASGGTDQILDAYRRYVRELKRIWTEVDPDTLAPEDLGALAQGMSWVAGVALEIAAVGVTTVEPES